MAEELANGLADLFEFLMTNGVPSTSITDLKDLVEAEKHMEALDAAQAYSTCYPYMKHSQLVFQLAGIWETLCTKYVKALDSQIKKIIAITADSKAENEVLEAAQAKKEELARVTNRANSNLIRMRALKTVYMKKEAGESFPKVEKVVWLNKEMLKAFREKTAAV